MIGFVLITILRIVEIAIIIEVLLSWLPGGIPNNKFTVILSQITEPFLSIGRKIQGAIAPNLPLDFSPIIGFIIIDLLRVIINKLF